MVAAIWLVGDSQWFSECQCSGGEQGSAFKYSAGDHGSASHYRSVSEVVYASVVAARGIVVSSEWCSACHCSGGEQNNVS